MREYGKVSPKFWIGATGKKLRKAGPAAQLVGMYLQTGTLASMLGLYYLPMSTLSHETGLGFEGASKGLASCIEAGFCAYDEASEIVWVYEMAKYQIADHLAANDLRCKGVQREYDELPENPYLQGFYDRYGVAYHMTSCRSAPAPEQSPIGGACKPLPSHEHEHEQEKEQEQEQDQSLSSSASPTSTDVRRGTSESESEGSSFEAVKRETDNIGQAASRVFAHWQEVHGKPKAKLDAKRRKLIRTALGSYSEADLCQSISGYRNSPHHMGQNDRNTVYDSIELILRDAARIDAGLGFYANPPRTDLSPKTRQARDQTADWTPPEMRNATA